MKPIALWILAVYAAVVGLQFVLVALGEPRSVWLWCDLIRLCN